MPERSERIVKLILLQAIACCDQRVIVTAAILFALAAFVAAVAAATRWRL